MAGRATPVSRDKSIKESFAVSMSSFLKSI
jgi:hypothetical protein